MTSPAPRLIDRRCWHHADREAAALCPTCSRFYCRECVTEHHGRMICADCVAKSAASKETPARTRAILWTVSALGGILAAWLFFYYLGMLLARIPSDFFGGPA